MCYGGSSCASKGGVCGSPNSCITGLGYHIETGLCPCGSDCVCCLKNVPTPTPKPSYISIPGIGAIPLTPTPTPTVSSPRDKPKPTSTPTPTPTVSSARYRCDTTNGRCIPDPNGSYPTIKACEMFCEAIPTSKPTPTPTPKPSYISIPGIGAIPVTPTPTIRPPYPGFGMYILPLTPTPVTTATRYRCNTTNGSCIPDPNGSYSTIKACSMFCEPQKYSCNSLLGRCEPNNYGSFSNLATCQESCKAPSTSALAGPIGAGVKPTESTTTTSSPSTPTISPYNSQLQAMLIYNQQYGVSPEVYEIMQSSKPEWMIKQGMLGGVDSLRNLISNPLKSVKQSSWDLAYDKYGWSQNKVLEGIDYAGDIMNEKYEDPEVQIALSIFSLGGAALYNAGFAAAPGIEEAFIQKVIQGTAKSPEQRALESGFRQWASQFGVTTTYTEIPYFKSYKSSVTGNIKTMAVGGFSSVNSKKITIVEPELNLVEPIVFHEISHALGWGGQVNPAAGLDDLSRLAIARKNETIATQLTVEHLLSSGMWPGHPWVQGELKYMLKNEQELIGILAKMPDAEVNEVYDIFRANYLELAKTLEDPYVTSELADKIINSDFESTFQGILEMSPYFKRYADYARSDLLLEGIIR